MRIRLEGEDVLTQKAASVRHFDDTLVETVRDMYRAMPRAGGIGLAAPQVGLSLQLFIIDRDIFPPGVVVNPLITASGGSRAGWEGCLSIPDKLYRVKRPLFVEFTANDEYGTLYHGKVKGLAARCFMHEFDHCQGKLLSQGGWPWKSRYYDGR